VSINSLSLTKRSSPIRWALNIKGIKFTTVWVEFQDIERVAKEVGAKPTATKPNGTPWYTVPIIVDPNTKTTISDSWNIALYLEKTYPSVRLFPEGTFGIQSAFQFAFASAVLSKFPGVMFSFIHANISAPAAAHVRWIREAQMGKTIEELSENADAQWESYKNGYGIVADWYEKNGTGFISGNSITYGDIIVAGWLQWIKRLAGEQSKEWKNIESWHGGRWIQLLNEFSKYS
jgi:glutathione S-transferase